MINGNPMLGQILGGVFGQAMGRRGMRGGGFGAGAGSGLGGGIGGLGGLGGAALGGILASALGRNRGVARAGGGGRSALIMLLLPIAMRWVQQNGGVGAVLERFQKRGFDKQAKSWVSTGPNETVDEGAIHQVVGQDELDQLAQRLGVPQQEVAHAFAEILPEMVNQLTPRGQVPAEADDVLDEGRETLERELQQVRDGEPTSSTLRH